MYSVVVPIYHNAEYVPLLISEFSRIRETIAESEGIETEFIFVVDGDPDGAHALLERSLPSAPFSSRLLLHARNFGSFAAIRTGLFAARGEFCAILAADLQEPPDLLISFLRALRSGHHDVAVGVRTEREDPAGSRFWSHVFWRLYRHLVLRELPQGGVDVFGCTRTVRTELLKLDEAHSSLVGLLYWLGFRRVDVPYRRRRREFGHSAWSFRRKVDYLLDSVFAFTDLPVRILSLLGAIGLCVATVLGLLVVVMRLVGLITVPGYTATILVVSFFAALNTLGLGVVGSYAWRAYENTKRRPYAVVQKSRDYPRPSSGVQSSNVGHAR